MPKKTPAKKAAAEKKTPKELEPSGFSEIDALHAKDAATLSEYLKAVGQYARESKDAGKRPKSAQVKLSKILARAIIHDLLPKIPEIESAQLGERNVAGALQNVQVDASQYHELDGLRIAVEIKPTYQAVGKAIWNRFRDIRAFAINIHLKFPFAVLGAVLVVPTHDLADKSAPKPTAATLARVVRRLEQTGKRRNESDAPHLLEAIAVIVFDPHTGEIDTKVPSPQSWLRWDAFINDLAAYYDARFGEGSVTDATQTEEANGGDTDEDDPT